MLRNCFGSDTLKKTAVYEWHERFKSGRESVEDDERSGRPSTSKTDENINKVREILINNRKLTIRELTQDLNIAYGSIQDIVVNGLGLRRVAAKLVPKELSCKKPRCHRQRHDFQSWIRPNIHQMYHYWRRDVGLWVRNPDEWMESFKWAKTKKTTSFSVEKESDAHGFHGLHYTLRIFARKSDS